MRIRPAGPVDRRDIVFAVLTGVFIAACTYQSSVNHAGRVMTSGPVALMVVASVVAAVLAALTGIPRVMARKLEEFWEGGALTRFAGEWSVYACASIVGSVAVVQLFASPPAR